MRTKNDTFSKPRWAPLKWAGVGRNPGMLNNCHMQFIHESFYNGQIILT